MSKCVNCGVTILDPTDKCPFCQWVLDTDNTNGIAMYPDARVAFRKFRFLENLFLFLSILIFAILAGINYFWYSEVMWCVIVGLALIYANVILRFAVVGKSGYQFKTVGMFVLAIVILIGIDYLTGYHGWALNYVFPAAIILFDVGILVLMIVNHRNWQSYMMIQILAILMSLIPVLLLAFGVITHALLVFGALAISVFLFLGTLIMGDQRARTELKRRFYI